MNDIIPDPLSVFDAETAAIEAGVKDPVTGIRMPYNKAEREQKRNDENKRKLQVAKHIITQLMEQELGREWLYDQLTLCNVFGTPYNPADTHLTAYNAGALIIGRGIENDIKKHSPKRYLMMLEEGWTREQLWNDEVADKV